jgi:general secretion pathway protein K
MDKIRVGGKGSILIISLWSVCLLSTLAVILGSQVRQKITLIKRLDERDKTYLIADAGVKRAISEIKKQQENRFHALNQSWSNNTAAFKDITVGDGKFSVSYELFTSNQKDTLEMGYGMIDEESKISINKADSNVLQRLFRVLGFEDTFAQDLAFSIIDWRDADSQLSVPLGSAEDSFYRNLAYPYEAKDGDFEVLEELLLVKGITNDIFGKIKNYITVYGSGKININTASGVVLFAIGLSRETIEKIISYRNGKDGIAATQDDNIFQDPQDVVTRLSQFYRLSDPELEEINGLTSKIVTKSEHFLIRSTGSTNNAKSKTVASSVVDSKGQVLSWIEF